MNDITELFINEFEIELLSDDEEFRYINGSKNYYISNYGRIALYKPNSKKTNFKFCNIKDDKNCLATTANIVYLNEDRCSRKIVGKLVAEAFIPNPNNFKFIKYKDSNYTNNYVDNIEWASKRKFTKSPDSINRPRRKSLKYYQLPIWVEEMCIWSLWDSIENAANFYKVDINSILDITNNEEKTGTIKGISQFGSQYDVTFSFHIPEKINYSYLTTIYNNLITKNK